MKKLDYENLMQFLNKNINSIEGAILYCNRTNAPKETTNGYINDLNGYLFLQMLVTISIGNISGSICNDDKCKLFAVDGEGSDAYLINISEISYFVSKEEYELFKPFMKFEKDERSGIEWVRH